MSKSTPSTSTTVNQNPVGQAQVPYLTGLWDAASNMAGRNGQMPAGGQDLSQLQNYAENQYNTTSGTTGQLVGSGANFMNNALAGNAGNVLPAAQQIGGLQGVGTNASNTGQYFAQQANNVAASTPGVVQPYQGALGNIAGQYGGLVGAGYGTQAAMAGLAGSAAGLGGNALGQFGGLAGQATGIANPAINQLYANSGMGVAGNPIFNALTGVAGGGANAANPAFSSGLSGLASGAYINPQSNPALAGTIQAATQPLVNQYQTAIAPQLASGFEGAGRYGSGAQANAQGQAQYGLGQALGTATSGIVNNAYNQGLQATLGAGSALGNIYNSGVANQVGAGSALGSNFTSGLGLNNQALAQAGQLGQSGYQLGGQLLGQGYGNVQQGLQNAGNLYAGGASALQGLGGTGLQGAANAYTGAGNLGLQGIQQQLQGYNMAGGLANQGYATNANALAQGGNLANAGTLNLGGIAQSTPDLANYPSSQLATAYNTNWAPLQNFAGLLGQPIGGNTISTTTQPYYQNTLSQVGAAAGGIGQLISAI